MRRFARVPLVVIVLGVAVAPAFAAKPGDKPKPAPEKRFARLDKNKDEKLSLEEFVGKKVDAMKDKAIKRFEKLDKDKDASLSFDEFKAGAKNKA